MVELNGEIATLKASVMAEENFPDRLGKLGVAKRLQTAVKKAGGNQAVAQRSGVPLGTLNNYLRGRHELKLAPFVALAAACAVSLDWLATGNSEMEAGDRTPEAASMRQSQSGTEHQDPMHEGEPARLRSSIDINRFADAIRLVREGFAHNNITPSPKWEANAQLALYDYLATPPAQSGDPVVLARLFTSQWFLDGQREHHQHFPEMTRPPWTD